MLKIYIAGRDYYTRFTEYPDTVLPLHWYPKGERWVTESRRMPKQAGETTLEALPPALQEQIQRYLSRWKELLPPVNE